jgi:hypothetical protein
VWRVVSVGNPMTFIDRYVDFGFAQDTAAKIANTEQFITNQSYHNGIRKRGEEIMKTLFELSKRERD